VERLRALGKEPQRKQDEFFMGDTLEEALGKAKKQFPEKIFHSIKIASPGVFTSSSI